MSDEAVPPIVIAEDLQGKFWVSVFETSESVTRQLEPWFATDENYRAFDSTGRVLDLVVEPAATERRLRFLKSKRPDTVVIQPGTELRPRELRELLNRFLEEQGHAAPVEPEIPTVDLIRRCAAIS